MLRRDTLEGSMAVLFHYSLELSHDYHIIIQSLLLGNKRDAIFS